MTIDNPLCSIVLFFFPKSPEAFGSLLVVWHNFLSLNLLVIVFFQVYSFTCSLRLPCFT